MSLITLVFAVLNFMRFGKGLKEKLNRRASIAM